MNQAQLHKQEEEIMRKLAAGITDVLTKLEWHVGFALILFEFNQPSGIGNYISNAEREDMIKVLRETADRLENRQDIPAVSHEIQ